MLSPIFETLINHYLENPLAQSIGLIALVIILYGFSQKNDIKLKYIAGSGTLLLGVHFFMLGFYVAALLCLIVMVRNFIAVRFIQSNKMIVLFSIIYVLLFFVTFENGYDALLICCGLIVNFAYFKLTGIALKVIILGNSLMWLIFNIYSQSIGGMITSASIVFVLIFSILSFFIHKIHLRDAFISKSLIKD